MGKKEELEEFLGIFKNLTESNKIKILKLVQIMNINSKVAEYLEKRVKYLSYDIDDNKIMLRYLVGDHKINCSIDEESITLICKQVVGG